MEDIHARRDAGETMEVIDRHRYRAMPNIMVIAEFASLAEAQAWAQQDPYVAAGVYADVTVKPFKQVF